MAWRRPAEAHLLHNQPGPKSSQGMGVSMTPTVGGDRRVPFNGLPRSAIHELRTPLTSIRGYAQLLLRGARSAEQAQRAYQTIFRESDRLAGFLNQLSKVAEATMGQAQVNSTRFDLEDLVAFAARQAASEWSTYTFVHRPGETAEVEADPRRIQELLACLLNNAAVYSEPGTTIETWVKIERREAVAAVRDQGIGIPANEREAVFECFQRASNVPRAGLSGSRGLGVSLFLARAAAAEAGGRVWADSELERGSTFYLALPLAAQAETAR